MTDNFPRPVSYEGKRIDSEHLARHVLHETQVCLDATGKLIPESTTTLQAAYNRANRLVDVVGDLIDAPEDVEPCFGLPRVRYRIFRPRCGACCSQDACQRVVNYRIALGLHKGKHAVSTGSHDRAAAIFGAAEKLFEWDQQNLDWVTRRREEREARSRLVAEQKSAARKVRQRIERKRARNERAIEKSAAAASADRAFNEQLQRTIPEAEREFDALEIAEQLAQIAPSLRQSDRTIRKQLSDHGLRQLKDYWISRRAVELAGPSGEPAMLQKVARVFRDRSSRTLSEKAARARMARLQTTMSTLREQGVRC